MQRLTTLAALALSLFVGCGPRGSDSSLQATGLDAVYQQCKPVKTRRPIKGGKAKDVVLWYFNHSLSTSQGGPMAVADALPIIAYTGCPSDGAETQPADWLFDGILFVDMGLYYVKPAKKGAGHSVTVVDADAFLADANAAMTALAQALATAEAVLGPRPQPIDVYFEIPHLTGGSLATQYSYMEKLNDLAKGHERIKVSGFYWGYQEEALSYESVIKDTKAYMKTHLPGTELVMVPSAHDSVIDGHDTGIGALSAMGVDRAAIQPNFKQLTLVPSGASKSISCSAMASPATSEASVCAEWSKLARACHGNPTCLSKVNSSAAERRFKDVHRVKTSRHVAGTEIELGAWPTHAGLTEGASATYYFRYFEQYAGYQDALTVYLWGNRLSQSNFYCGAHCRTDDGGARVKQLGYASDDGEGGLRWIYDHLYDMVARTNGGVPSH